MSKPYDPHTGEVLIPLTVYKRPGDVVVTIDPKHQSRNIKHVRVRTARAQSRVYDNLTISECGFLFKLLPYLEWETNIVCGDGVISSKGKPLKFIEIEAVTGISKQTRINIVKSLIEKKVLGYLVVGGKRVALVVNPNYVIRGRKPDDALKKAFELEENLDDEYE